MTNVEATAGTEHNTGERRQRWLSALEQHTGELRSSPRVHKVSPVSLSIEIFSHVVSFGLYGYYWYAVVTAPVETRRESGLYQLLFAFAIVATYRRICLSLWTYAKFHWLQRRRWRRGSTQQLPYADAFSRFTSLAPLADVVSFVLLCLITNLLFPMRECKGLDYQPACTSLRMISIVFVSSIALGALMMLITSIFLVWIQLRNRGRSMADGEEDGAMPIRRGLRYVPGLPDAVRQRMIAALPTTNAVPDNGDVCAVCLDAGAEGDQWRKLPCSHSFHVDCIDGWLFSNGTCPKCRQDPLQPSTTPVHHSTHQVAGTDMTQIDGDADDSTDRAADVAGAGAALNGGPSGNNGSDDVIVTMNTPATVHGDEAQVSMQRQENTEIESGVLGVGNEGNALPCIRTSCTNNVSTSVIPPLSLPGYVGDDEDIVAHPDAATLPLDIVADDANNDNDNDGSDVDHTNTGNTFDEHPHM